MVSMVAAEASWSRCRSALRLLVGLSFDFLNPSWSWLRLHADLLEGIVCACDPETIRQVLLVRGFLGVLEIRTPSFLQEEDCGEIFKGGMKM